MPACPRVILLAASLVAAGGGPCGEPMPPPTVTGGWIGQWDMQEPFPSTLSCGARIQMRLAETQPHQTFSGTYTIQWFGCNGDPLNYGPFSGVITNGTIHQYDTIAFDFDDSSMHQTARLDDGYFRGGALWRYPVPPPDGPIKVLRGGWFVRDTFLPSPSR